MSLKGTIKAACQTGRQPPYKLNFHSAGFILLSLFLYGFLENHIFDLHQAGLVSTLVFIKLHHGRSADRRLYREMVPKEKASVALDRW